MPCTPRDTLESRLPLGPAHDTRVTDSHSLSSHSTSGAGSGGGVAGSPNNARDQVLSRASHACQDRLLPARVAVTHMLARSHIHAACRSSAPRKCAVALPSTPHAPLVSLRRGHVIFTSKVGPGCSLLPGRWCCIALPAGAKGRVSPAVTKSSEIVGRARVGRQCAVGTRHHTPRWAPQPPTGALGPVGRSTQRRGPPRHGRWHRDEASRRPCCHQSLLGCPP